MADENKADNADGENKAEEEGNSKKAENQPVTFSTEQQTKLQELIDDSYTKAFGKAETKYTEQIDALNLKIAELSKTDDAAKSDKSKSKVTQQEYEDKIAEINKKHDEDIEKSNGKNKAILDRILKGDIIAAAAKSDCTAPDELADVLIAQGRVTLNDEGGYDINPPEGITKIGDDGKPISLNLFIDRFIAANQHWKKFTGDGGTGSRDGGSDGGGKLLKNMTRDQIMELPTEEFQKLDSEQLLKNSKGWCEV